MQDRMADPPLAAGQIIGGRYRVEAMIGAGSMGYVVSAWHLELDQRVALKILNPDVFERGEALQRFRREVRAAARIRSEHVARVTDVGTLEAGEPYMVMELLQGNNVEEEITRRGTIPLTEAVGYVLEAMEAVAEAHAAGIVHRDLKPANLFITRRADRTRLVKVLDFGISKSLADSQASHDMSLTKTGVIIGSPLYMSPEQMRSTKDADARSDIWALGAILFQLVTGRPPYMGETIPELCAQLFSEDAPPPSTLRRDLPPGLDLILARALARDPKQRYQNVAEFGEALVEFAPASRIHVERARRVLFSQEGPSSEWPGRDQAPGAPTIAASVSTLEPQGTTAAIRARRRWPAIVAVAALLVIGAFVVKQVGLGASPKVNPASAPAAHPEAPTVAPAPQGTAAPPAEATQPVPSVPSGSADAAHVSVEPVTGAIPTVRPSTRAPNVSRPSTPGPAAPPPRTDGISDFGGRR